MAKSLDESSAYFKIALFLILVAVILQAIGFSTPNWVVFSYEGVVGHRTGLWQSCLDLLNIITCEESNFKGQGWFIAVQVLEAVGLACLVTSLILSIALLLAVTSKLLVKVNINTCSVGGSLIGIGLTIFVIKTFYIDDASYSLGYSYWLSLAAVFDLMIVVVLLVCDKRQSGGTTIHE